MKHELHHNKKWLTPCEAAEYTGKSPVTFRRQAKAGLIRCKENPARKGQGAWLYDRKDIDEHILRIR